MEGHTGCQGCSGRGYITIGYSDYRCQECDGWGEILDIDSYELPV